MPDLNKLMEAQSQLQESAYGRDIKSLEGEERTSFIKDMTLALSDELHEALAEVGWKPWATSRHVNEEAFKGELIDAFHFFMNLCLAAGMDAFELTEKYYLKNAKNLRRQQDGYDGVEGKCKDCGRALDDDAVLCTELICMKGYEA